MHTVYTVADRRSTVVQLRQHTTADVTIVDQSLCLGSCQSGNKCGLVIDVLVQSLDIRQKCQFLRMYCFGDSAGRIIRIDIVGVIILVQSNGSDDGQVILLQHVKENIRIHAGDLTHITDVLTVGIFFLYLKQAAVFTADTYCFHAQLFHHGHKALIYLVQYHFRDLHGLLIGDTQTVDELCLFSDLADPAADLLTAAVNDDGLETYQFQQRYVLDDVFLQFLIAHGAAAVFYHDDLTVEFLYVRKRLDQHLCFFHYLFHIFFHFYPHFRRYRDPPVIYLSGRSFLGTIVRIDLHIIIA